MALPPVPRRTAQPTRDMGTPTNSPPQAARPTNAPQGFNPAQAAQNAQGPRYNAAPQQANLGMGSRKNVVPPRQVKPLPPLNQGTRGIAPNPGGMQGSMVPPSLGPAPQMDATDRGIVPPAVSPQTNLGDPTGQLPVPGLLQDMPPRGYGR